MAGYLNYSTNNVKNNGEADMDFDLVMGLLPEQNVYLYQIGKSSQDPYNGEYPHRANRIVTHGLTHHGHR